MKTKILIILFLILSLYSCGKTDIEKLGYDEEVIKEEVKQEKDNKEIKKLEQKKDIITKDNIINSIDDENILFIKQYYIDLGDGKIEEVYNKTSWETGKKSFDTFNGWYEGIKEVKVNSIESLGNDKYKIDVDLFYEGKEKPENYKMIKKVIENGGTKILETLKK